MGNLIFSILAVTVTAFAVPGDPDCCLCIYDNTSPDVANCDRYSGSLFSCAVNKCTTIEGKCYPSFYADCRGHTSTNLPSCNAKRNVIPQSEIDKALAKKAVLDVGIEKSCNVLSLGYDGHTTTVDMVMDQARLAMAATGAKKVVFETRGCEIFANPSGSQMILKGASKCLAKDETVCVTGSKSKTTGLVGPLAGRLSQLTVTATMDPVSFTVTNGQCVRHPDLARPTLRRHTPPPQDESLNPGH